MTRWTTSWSSRSAISAVEIRYRRPAARFSAQARLGDGRSRSWRRRATERPSRAATSSSTTRSSSSGGRRSRTRARACRPGRGRPARRARSAGRGRPRRVAGLGAEAVAPVEPAAPPRSRRSARAGGRAGARAPRPRAARRPQGRAGSTAAPAAAGPHGAPCRSELPPPPAKAYPPRSSANPLAGCAACAAAVWSSPPRCACPSDHRRRARRARDRRGRPAAERQLPRLDDDHPPTARGTATPSTRPRRRRSPTSSTRTATGCRSAAAIRSRRRCGDGGSYGKTVWWDFKPPSAGGVEVEASGGFDVVVAVYTWSERTSRITRTSGARTTKPGSEEVLIPRVSARRPTTRSGRRREQRRRAAELSTSSGSPTPTATASTTSTDNAPRSRASALGGCPPELRSTPRIVYQSVGSGAADHRPRDRRRAQGRARRGR